MKVPHHWALSPIRRTFTTTAIVALLSAVLAGPLPAHAQSTTINVTTYSDELNSSSNGKCSLREAVRAANSDTAVGGCPAGNGADTIVLKGGTYKLTRSGRDEDNAATGDLDLRGELTITGAGASSTTVDGNKLDRVFHLQSGTNVTISTLTVRNGLAKYSVQGSFGYGGGISSYGNLTLESVIIRNNRSEKDQFSNGGFGGGVYSDRAFGAGGVVTIRNSTIRDNSAEYGSGVVGEFVITNSHILYNRSTLSGGVVGHGSIDRSVISGNRGSFGAGFSGGGSITNTTISSNISDYTGGGVRANDDLTITNSTISGNTTALNGGGIFIEGGLVTISGSTISGNYARGTFKNNQGGGAIAIVNGELNLANSTVSGNKANENGGAIYVEADGDGYTGRASINNSTFANNIADNDGNGTGDGGAFFNQSYSNGSRISIRNTLLGAHTDRGGQAPVCFGKITSFGYNLVRDTKGCTLEGDTTGNLLNVDPKLGSLQNNGGPTKTQALNSGSPAIDAGNPAAVGSNENACAPADQRGNARPTDGNNDSNPRCDIGAVERF